MQPNHAAMQHLSDRATAALGALFSSFVVVLGLGMIVPAPPAPPAIIALLWLGAWALDFLFTLPFLWKVTAAVRSRQAARPPWRELLLVSLIGLVPAAAFGWALLTAANAGNASP